VRGDCRDFYKYYTFLVFLFLFFKKKSERLLQHLWIMMSYCCLTVFFCYKIFVVDSVEKINRFFRLKREVS
jgi:hypothetical protein